MIDMALNPTFGIILIADRYITISYAKATFGNIGDEDAPRYKVVFDKVKYVEYSKPYTKVAKGDDEAALERARRAFAKDIYDACELLREAAGPLDKVVIGCCIALQSTMTADKNEYLPKQPKKPRKKNPDYKKYGKIANNVIHRHWSHVSLYDKEDV